MKKSERLKQEADKLDNNLAYLGAMLKTECVFSCYALNAKNAIKKFNQFKASINHKGGLQQGQIVLPKYINIKRK